MIDKVLLFPYWFTLKLRHLLFDKGIRKVSTTEVPSICVGNITVGGTGKTPHTELLLRTLLNDEEWADKSISVLSRGYKRSTRGFQQVVVDGSAKEYGDEPLQIKRKFPNITVAVDKSRKEGCSFLCNPEALQTSRKAKRCKHKELPKSDLIILDDAFQHRSIKASVSIVLVDYNRPVFKDHLMPFGKLRDLPERLAAADIIIVTKCPPDMNVWEKSQWMTALNTSEKQQVFFTKICYDTALPVYPTGDTRYTYAKKLILFSGIANDTPLRHFLSSDYKIVRHFNFPDHHKFSHTDIRSIEGAVKDHPTSVVMTTEKDCQRVRDCKKLSDNLKVRMFYTPIKTEFLSEEEKTTFVSTLKSYLK